MKKIDWLKDIQAAVAELKLTPAESRFHQHPFYGVGVSDHSAANFKHIFGASLVGRLKSMRIKHNRFPPFEVQLPDDSVIFFRHDKKGLIVASKNADLVLKIFLSPDYTHLLDEEIKTLKYLQNTAFAPNAPRFKSEGTTTQGARWLITGFCSNTGALTHLSHPEKYLFENQEELVMKPMTNFYQSHQLQIMDLSSWLHQTQGRIEAHPSRDLLRPLLKKLESQANEKHQLIHTRIHNDLHAGNILVNDKETIFIDWEGGINGLVLIDFFDFARRYIKADKLESEFLEFMAGKRAMPAALVAQFKFYQRWALENFNAHVPSGAERMTYLIYVLERSLILFENRGVDRMKDKKGFEFKVLSCE